MKTSKYKLLTTGLVMCVLLELSTNSFAQLPNQNSLIGIKSMSISASCTQEATEIGLKAEHIEKDIANQLEQASIKIVPKIDLHKLPGNPELRIIIKAYKPPSQEIFVYNLDISLRQTVALARDPQIKITAITWQTTWLSHDTEQKLVKGIQQNLKILVDEFIRDYHKANQSDVHLNETNDANTTSLTAPEDSSKQPGKQAVIKYKYVASKNSDVFHTPNCRSAKRISPENIIGYNSRDDAINAGKRPCKVCKP